MSLLRVNAIPQADAWAEIALGVDQDHTGLLEGTLDHGRAGTMQIVPPLLIVSHGRTRNAGSIGKLFLRPVDQTTGRSTLLG
ncbi:hypothetical protein OCOJLMKI_5180 [Methylobacterium iners]|uniref:Uncharacterized protein n=1 Tax=Methylobacterium iners TaxID=418707 RepID=A0ABQ4S490_9HYPH|nr:hypothetical protein OCOJLMKI_5180 [Methylobacterium iners]